MTFEVTEDGASLRSPFSHRKVRRRWPVVPKSFLLLFFLHNARYSMQQQSDSSSSSSSRLLTLFDVDNDGGPLDAHSVEKRKIGDASVAVSSHLSFVKAWCSVKAG